MGLPAAPKDKTKREHVAKVRRVVFCDPDQPFVILALEDDLTVKGPFDAEDFTSGTVYKFLGRWEDDQARGPFFRAATFVVHQPAGRAGTIRYLCRTADLSEGDAKRLWDAHRERAIPVLRDTPDLARRACPRMSAEHAREASLALQLDARVAAVKVELHDLFAQRGFHGRLIDQAVKKWGARAPAVIRRNPFVLMPLGFGAGFKRCDKLWCDLNLPPGSLKRQAYVAWQLVRTDGHGHTWLSATDLAAKLLELIPEASPVRAFRLALRARLLKRHRDEQNRLWLASYPRGTAEERVAANVARLLRYPALWPADRVEVGRDGRPSAHQVGKLQLATAGAVGMLLGGPGTGKTTTLGYLLREVAATHGLSQVTLAAPTGKAAVRMTQAIQLAGIDLRAMTIHSTLEIGRNGHDGDGWGFRRNASNRLEALFYVIDEVSMCDADLMADLLDAVPDGANVLFIGDPHQLPPVGHGAPLRDMISSGVIPVGELTDVQRNAGSIVHACSRVKNDEEIEIPTALDLDASPPRNLKLIEARDGEHAADLVEGVLKALTRFNNVWQTQVIVARNKGTPIARQELNARLHPLLNPEGFALPGNPFKVGDKIICLRNSRLHAVEAVGELDADQARRAEHYQTAYAYDPETELREAVEVFTANGEIGRVEAIGPKVALARFSEGEHLVRIPLGKDTQGDDDEGGQEEKGRGCQFDHAYAITVHRAQGSEAPCIICVADERGGMVAGKEWWYTAISRASKLCVIIGRKAIVDKQRVRTQLIRRKTFLAERLTKCTEVTPRESLTG